MKDWTNSSLAEIKEEFQRGFHQGGDWDPDAFPRAHMLIEDMEKEIQLLRSLAIAADAIMNARGILLTEAFKKYDEALEELKSFKKGASHEITFT